MFVKKDTNERVRMAILGLLYAGFVSLGFSDAVLGVAWPKMRAEFGLSIESVGIVMGVIKVGGMVSSVAYGYLRSRPGVGRLMAINAALVASAMFGYAISPWWALTVILTIPFGMCAGAASSAMNEYAAVNYSSRQLNWVNCSWGVGMTCSTLLLTAILAVGSWRVGYAAIAAIIAVFAVAFSRARRIWRAGASVRAKGPTHEERMAIIASRHIVFPGLKKFRRVFLSNCLFIFAYAGVESAPGLWGTSLLMGVMGASMETAGFAVSMYWGALTVGRLVVGAVSSRFPDAAIIRGGLLAAAAGAILLAATESAGTATFAFILTGFGLAPVFPSIVHDIPRRVGDGPAGRLIGVMLGFSYLGGAILPALIGYVASRSSIFVMAPIMAILLFIVAASHEVSAFNALYKSSRARACGR
jgi:fucose permease